MGRQEEDGKRGEELDERGRSRRGVREYIGRGGECTS